MELTHYRTGTVYCASPSFADNGNCLHGYEQRHRNGDGRGKKNARVARQNTFRNAE